MTETPRPFTRDGLGYSYLPVDDHGVAVGVRLKADYLSRRAGDVTAEIVIESILPGTASHLHQGRLNLGSTQSKSILARALSAQTGGALDWRGLIEDLAVAVLRAERQGEPFAPIGPARAPVQRHFRVERILPDGRATMLYGPWANGKGWIAVGLTTAVAAGRALADLGVVQGPTLYLDWEDDQDVFDERVWMVCRGLGLAAPPTCMYYRACRGSLTSQVNQIARFVDEHGIVLCVTDSVGLAAGVVGERGSYEETALSLFDGLRQIRCTHLLVDHVSEEGRQNSKTVGKAYGSIYKMALVRNAWEIRKDQDPGTTAFRVGLYHTKANHGPLLPPLGFRIDFATQNTVHITAEAIDTSNELAARLPVHARITALLQEEDALRASEIALRLGITETHARKELNQHGARFWRAPDSRWALRSPRPTEANHRTPAPAESELRAATPGSPGVNGSSPSEDAVVPPGWARLENGEVVPF